MSGIKLFGNDNRPSISFVTQNSISPLFTCPCIHFSLFIPTEPSRAVCRSIKMSLRFAASQSLRSATRSTPRLTPFLASRSYADSASQPITEELIKAKLVEALKPSEIKVIDTSGELERLSDQGVAHA